MFLLRQELDSPSKKIRPRNKIVFRWQYVVKSCFGTLRYESHWTVTSRV